MEELTQTNLILFLGLNFTFYGSYIVHSVTVDMLFLYKTNKGTNKQHLVRCLFVFVDNR